ncbi:MAG: hypothetical protein MI919_43035 [Holophagales bacterium]|nr:hypothetical protein [Holophagales bacterium]
MNLNRAFLLLFAAVLLGASLQPAAAQVVQPIDPVNPPPGIYSYAVKFVCGFQKGNTGVLNTPIGQIPYGEPSVKAGNYATEVNIYNPSNDTEVEKRFLFLVEDGQPVGREPNVVGPAAFDAIGLPSGTATMDDCNRIAELAPPPSPFSLRIGFMVLTSKEPLDVTAVYTAELCSDWTVTGAGRMCSTPYPTTNVNPFGTALSIDVEQIDGKFRPQ